MPKLNAAFWEWFGKSVVRNEDGTPKVVYHGSISPWVTSFSESEAGRGIGGNRGEAFRGFFFSSSKENARYFADEQRRQRADEDPDSWDFVDDRRGFFAFVPDKRGEYILSLGPYRSAEAAQLSAKKEVSLYNDAIRKGEDTWVMGVYLKIENPRVLDSTFGRGIDTEIRAAMADGHDGVIFKDITDGYLFATTFVVFSPSKIKSVDNDGTWGADDPSIRSNPPVQSKFSTQLGYGGIPEGFKIESPAGTTAIGYVSNADFPNDSSSPTRGELFLVNVQEGQRRRGEGMSISIQALRLMKEHGCSTVNMSAISKGGAAIVDRLIREGYISKAIRTSETGKSEYRIGPREVGENPPVRRLPKWMKSPESMFRWALKNVGDFGEPLENDDPDFRAGWKDMISQNTSEYLDIAEAACKRGYIDIHRTIVLESERCLKDLKSLLKCVDLEEIGHYWSAKEEGAGSFGAPEMGFQVTLHGVVNFDGIDWEHGFTSFCFYPDQWEIAVKHNVNIALAGIENHKIDPPLVVSSGSSGGYIHRSMRPADENPSPKRFWGKAGAGILFHCTGDGTYLLTLRSEEVEQPGTLGIPGGACGEEGMFTGKEGKQIGESQAWACAMRETKEELSWWPKQKQVAQVVLFQKANFQYQTFIVDIPASEKAEAERSIKLNWENDDHVWMSIPEMVSAREQLHFGMQHVLEQIGV